jgi:hypothetical protein
MPEIDGAALRKQFESLLSEYGSDMEKAGGYAAAFERREERMHLEDAAETRAAILALLSEVEALRKDLERFSWYFSDKPKGDWLMTYLDGVRIGWTTDEWRAAIDAALSASPPPPGVVPDNQQEP